MQKAQQAIKWSVYTLLLVNYALYIIADWQAAAHTLSATSGILDWSSAFATSIDESAWFVLLFMFELETYVLGDAAWQGWVARAVRGARLFCYLMIAHTVYAYIISVLDLRATIPVENVASLCAMTNADVSYVYNLTYTDVNEKNCGSLSAASQFFWVASDPVVTDAAGLALERTQAWFSLAGAIAWLLVIAAIETVVRLQGAGVAGGAILVGINRLKLLLYLAIIAMGIYWASLSHWLYLWDELLWILGFTIIEMNVSAWRKEMLDERPLT